MDVFTPGFDHNYRTATAKSKEPFVRIQKSPPPELSTELRSHRHEDGNPCSSDASMEGAATTAGGTILAPVHGGPHQPALARGSGHGVRCHPLDLRQVESPASSVRWNGTIAFARNSPPLSSSMERPGPRFYLFPLLILAMVTGLEATGDVVFFRSEGSSSDKIFLCR